MTLDDCHICGREMVRVDWTWSAPNDGPGRWVAICARCQEAQQLPTLARYGG